MRARHATMRSHDLQASIQMNGVAYLKSKIDLHIDLLESKTHGLRMAVHCLGVLLKP